MTTKRGTRCLICDTHFVNGGGYICHNCNAKIESERRQAPNGYDKYLVYKDWAVGMRLVDGRYQSELTQRDPDTLPESKTINLNKWVDGFTRDEVKRMKKLVLSLAVTPLRGGAKA